MNSFLLYLLEASLVLVVLYGAYRLLLTKETFFNFNRFFLMAILLLSLLLPLVSFELGNSERGFINQQSTELGKARNAYHTSFDYWSEWKTVLPESEASGWQQFWSQDWDVWRVLMVLAAVIYTIGFAYRVLKLSLGYVRIYRLKKQLISTDFDGVKVSEIPAEMAPFSFLNTVFMPQDIEDATEYSQILAHEKTHIQQRHSIDLIFVQLVAAFLWFNPVVWLLIKSLKQTHEYIADKNMLRQGFSLVEYQSLLLRQLISDNSYGLVHNFNLSFIKKRITMMSIKESGWAGWSKAMVALSFILLMGVLTAQSNAVLDVPALETNHAAKQVNRKIDFSIDGVSLSEGLRFSDLKNYTGEFRFEFNNGVEDNIHVGLDLLRDGNLVAHASRKLKEGASFKIRELLDKAKKEDYLVIDIIEGPADVEKLYNIPLFRDSKVAKKNVMDDLPPPPVTLTLNGATVGPQNSVQLSNLKESDNPSLSYDISGFVDFRVLEKQGGVVKTTLVRNGEAVLNVLNIELKRKDEVELKELLAVARKGDTIMIQFGKADGLRFGSQFLLE